MSIPRVTYQPLFHGYPIQASLAYGLGCREDILDRQRALAERSVAERSRSFFMRLDFRFPLGYDPSSQDGVFRRFMASFVTHLRRHGLSPLYLWAREQGEGPNPHVHVALWLNGSETRSAYGHWAKAVELWGMALGMDAKGLVHLCPTAIDGKAMDGVMIDRRAEDFQERFDHCFHWGAYLSKAKNKGDAPYHAREFGSSQIPRL